MLVQFMLKNVLSFKDETVFNMTAVNAYKEHEYNLINNGKEKFLKVSAIYGANASGKSNLFLAMFYFQRIVAESFNNVADDETIAIEEYYFPFSFEQEDENSEFEIIEIIDDYEYKYGFEYNAEQIVSEWMYRKNIQTNRNSVILERTEDAITLGASVRKECEIYKEQIPAETLALSFFNKLKLKTEIFQDCYSGIMNIMMTPAAFYENKNRIKKLLPGMIDHEEEKLNKFLHAIDSGIQSIFYVKTDKEIEFFTTHTGRDGEKYALNLFSESDGTIRSILIFIYAGKAIEMNRVMFVDELNIKLHPLLLKFIVDLFYEKNSNAQLIYTTHDTTLMSRKFFRRDQIWFVQKDEFGYSKLTALSDFKVRLDASFEKDYLAGVYGGIPFLKEFDIKEGK